ncbi:MAG: DUF3460 family protein [Pseudomonadota bacterium]
MNRKTERYRIGHGGYVSEFTRFLDNYLVQHPEVKEDQRRAWYILWDRHVDLDALEREREDTVPAKPYQFE